MEAVQNILNYKGDVTVLHLLTCTRFICCLKCLPIPPPLPNTSTSNSIWLANSSDLLLLGIRPASLLETFKDPQEQLQIGNSTITHSIQRVLNVLLIKLYSLKPFCFPPNKFQKDEEESESALQSQDSASAGTNQRVNNGGEPILLRSPGNCSHSGVPGPTLPELAWLFSPGKDTKWHALRQEHTLPRMSTPSGMCSVEKGWEGRRSTSTPVKEPNLKEGNFLLIIKAWLFSQYTWSYLLHPSVNCYSLTEIICPSRTMTQILYLKLKEVLTQTKFNQPTTFLSHPYWNTLETDLGVCLFLFYTSYNKNSYLVSNFPTE